MSASPKEQVNDVLGDLAKVTDTTQFLNGVQRNPELIIEAVITLADQSVGDGTTDSQLQITYKKLNELLVTSSSLEIAHMDIEALKNIQIKTFVIRNG
ncbi:hypothetical protein HI914_06819 [Erysiphe necator]|nr:hypothetical protein HI914_06819 [Erysiphe necator]